MIAGNILKQAGQRQQEVFPSRRRNEYQKKMVYLRTVIVLLMLTLVHNFLMINRMNVLVSDTTLKVRSKAAVLDSTIFVISLQGTIGSDKRNERRLDKFKEKWAAKCGPASLTQIHHCPGIHDTRRGYGITTSYLFCLQMAKEMNLNVSVFFEDDARLFDKETTFCDNERRKELWTNIPSDTLLVFLGGHSWVYPNKKTNYSEVFKESSLSFGAYGLAVPHQSINILSAVLEEAIRRGFSDEKGVHHRDFLSPERIWYRLAQRINKKNYAVDPLIVWHEGGFSNTWGRMRGDLTGLEEYGEGINGISWK